MGGSRELGGYARERSLIKSTAFHFLRKGTPCGTASATIINSFGQTGIPCLAKTQSNYRLNQFD